MRFHSFIIILWSTLHLVPCNQAKAQKDLHIHWQIDFTEEGFDPEIPEHPYVTVCLVLEDWNAHGDSIWEVSGDMLGHASTTGESLEQGESIGCWNWYAGGGEEFEIRREAGYLVLYHKYLEEITEPMMEEMEAEGIEYEEPVFEEVERIPVPFDRHIEVGETVLIEH